jgi:hypothetical protein
VKIPSGDRKLINWPKWRDRHQPWFAYPPNVRRLTKDWWGYAGTIPLTRIVNTELLLHQATPWYDDADCEDTDAGECRQRLEELTRRRLAALRMTKTAQ